MHQSIPGLPGEAIEEVEVYFQYAWGNRERVDYGSGMELNFLSWLWVILASSCTLSVRAHGQSVLV